MMLLYGHFKYAGNFSIDELRNIASELDSKSGGPVNGINPFFILADEIEIRLNQRPSERIFKMGRSDHIRSFFEHGTLQLGTVLHYSNSGQAEVGDNREDAPIVLIGERLGCTIGAAVRGGFNHYLFCASLGEVDDLTMSKFGYDDAFEIVDPVGFANAVATCLPVKNTSFGRCIYTPYKAMLGILDDTVPMDRIDHSLLDILGPARNFLKPPRYRHQREFRFTWRVDHQTFSPIVINCPAAVQFARKRN